MTRHFWILAGAFLLNPASGLAQEPNARRHAARMSSCAVAAPTAADSRSTTS
jgi:hypothetical protein